MPNRLAHEKSPYLLQHAHNPVDWFPWGPEALRQAEETDRPILVSIGYSACHWCHVMERESFEDAGVAALMNQNFINIKVDREERPDVDAIYMEAVQALTGQGGWPLNVFLTPDGKPFHGGTYFPPDPRPGMPGWSQLLQGIIEVFRDQRTDVTRTAASLTQVIREAQRLAQSSETLNIDLLEQAYRGAAGQFDLVNGGFGGAPKFPQPMVLEFVLRAYRRREERTARDFVELSLRKMAEGGICDQLGGGFHRYTVDGAWVVPHFEKMLYDNAQLARVYLQAYQASRDPSHRVVAESILDYLLRDLQSPEGGFYSSEDADSEGVEGKFYVWTPTEVRATLDPTDAHIFEVRYGVRPEGNFEGKTILTVATSIPDMAARLGKSQAEIETSLVTSRERLLAVRAQRVRPAKDTKILVSWNALAIRALAEAAQVLERPDYLSAALRAADLIDRELRVDGSLRRSYKDGASGIPAFLEDHGYLLEALLSLYEATGDTENLKRALVTADEIMTRFWDDAQGAFFDTPDDASDLVVRPKGFFDNPIPSGNASATFGLLRLEAITGDSKYTSWALPGIRAVRDVLTRAPLAFGHMLCALDFFLSTPVQAAIVGEQNASDTRELLRVVHGRYLPNKVVVIGNEGDGQLFEARAAIDGRATAYICENFACRLPVTHAGELSALLDQAARVNPES